MKLLLMEKAWQPFHASACIWNDTGICILGGKFAGKTSTLVNLLSRPGARLVTNDNLFLRDGGMYLEGCGFPQQGRFADRRLGAYPKLVDWIGRLTIRSTRRSMPRHSVISWQTTPADELGSRSEKIVLLATELAEQLDVPIQQVTRIELVLVVVFDPALERSRLAPSQIRSRSGNTWPAPIAAHQGKEYFLQRFFDFNDTTLQAALDGLLENSPREWRFTNCVRTRTQMSTPQSWLAS